MSGFYPSTQATMDLHFVNQFVISITGVRIIVLTTRLVINSQSP